MSEVIEPAEMVMVSTTATETVAAWDVAAQYEVGDQARLDGTQLIYQSLADQNTGNLPTSSPNLWAAIGPTNRHAVFDDSYRTQSTRADSITYVISAADFTERLALLNLTGAEAHVLVTKDGAEVYNRTFSLLDDTGIVDLWTYFYEPYVYIRDLVVEDIPTMAGLTYTATVTGPGTVGIGLIRIGRGKFIGDAVYGSGVGTTRYSVPKFDQYGNYAPTIRPSAKRGSFDMHLAAHRADDVKSFLDKLDITPAVFNMTGGYTRGKVWGFAKEADFTWSSYGIDKYRLTIEGLT